MSLTKDVMQKIQQAVDALDETHEHLQGWTEAEIEMPDFGKRAFEALERAMSLLQSIPGSCPSNPAVEPSAEFQIGTPVRLTAFYPSDIFGEIPSEGWTIKSLYMPKANYEIVHASGKRMVVCRTDFVVNRT